MEKTKFIQSFLLKGLLAAAFTLALFALTPTLASAQTACWDQSLGCTAQDMDDLAVEVLSVDSVGCVDTDANPTTPPQVQVDLKVTMTAKVERRDYGIVISQDGNNILGTSYATQCEFDWLPSPLTTTDATNLWPYDDGGTLKFFDSEAVPQPRSDGCGDLLPGDQAVRYYYDLWVACVDLYTYDPIDQDSTLGPDGQIDMDVCFAYDQTDGADCYSEADTLPGTSSKCGCLRVNISVSPTAIEGLSFSASSQALPVGLVLGGVGLVLIAGVLLSVYLRRRARA